MSNTALQEAPPVEAPKSAAFFRFAPFPAEDSYPLTIVGHNYIKEHEFARTDDSGQEYTEKAAAIELFLGTKIEGKAYFVKTWPQKLSISDRANYYKWFLAATGKAPVAGSKTAELNGKVLLGEIQNAVGKKGGEYSKIKSLAKCPAALVKTATPLAELRPAFEAAIANQDKQEGGDQPF